MDTIVQEDINWLIANLDYKKFEGCKILITGANGSIARYLVYFFMNISCVQHMDCHVYALVRDQGKAKALFGEWLDTPFFHLQVGDVIKGIDFVKDMTYIFHAAGISKTKLFSTNPVDVIASNVEGTYNLLDNLKGASQLRKFVFFSSGAVYGDPQNDNLPLDENMYYPFSLLNANACYVEGKRMGEVWCNSYWKQYKLPTVVARIGHTYGPGIDLESGHVFSDFVNCILNRQNIDIKNPQVMRPFTYVRDLVQGILILASAGNCGEAYNIWNEKANFSVGDLAHILVGDVFRERQLKVYYQNREYLHRADNNSSKRLMQDTLKMQKLGWDAIVDVREGFARTVRSFEERNVH